MVGNQSWLIPSAMESDVDEWTFNGDSTREYTHCYHDYPARMHPLIARKLMRLYGQGAQLLFDPYCGTGTSLVEALLFGCDAKGTDLNPHARLIAMSKVNVLEMGILEGTLCKYTEFSVERGIKKLALKPSERVISNLEFWFVPSVITALQEIKAFIDDIEDAFVRMFFLVAFSETARECSNTRNSEFKLYRIPSEKLKYYNPDVYETMNRKLIRNARGFRGYYLALKENKTPHVASVYDFNSVDTIPLEIISPESVDIVVTSPPYGDSHTTVAYGQYSRLSAAWLGMLDCKSVDRRLMGGTIYRAGSDLGIDCLIEPLRDIQEQDPKRAKEVKSFYKDLRRSICNVSGVLKVGGYACYVVGNRRVKGIELPTDKAIIEFFTQNGFDHIASHTRGIPNKRMPKRNSPSNIPGVNDVTMTNEYIVVMRKRNE